ncbi:hypothetical protein BH10ACI3_BH10ACI3_04030 [soil metagenome]
MDSSLSITSGAVSDRGLSEKRPQNEDSYLEMGKCGIYAVADGVGGAQAGEVASQMAVEILGEAFTNLAPGADAESVMRTAIERANAAIHQMAEELPQLSSMATTVVALHIAGNIATIGHVGDSRLYRVDREGYMYRETDDHSMVAEEVRAGRMTEEQAENHPSRNIISRALGAEPTVEIDLKTIMIEPGNAFLLCSDGITRHVSDEEIKGVLTFGGTPAEICEFLKSVCYERGAEDNLTAVVIKVGDGTGVAVATADVVDLPDEEPTVATARTMGAERVEDDDDQLLELDTSELKIPETVDDEVGIGDETIPLMDHETLEFGDATVAFEDRDSLHFGEETLAAIDQESSREEPNEVVEVPKSAETVSERPQTAHSSTMFGGYETENYEESKTGSIGKILSAFGLLFLGSVIGLGVYHFVLAPKPVEQVLPQLTEMQSGNQALSAFEDNRRIVDRSPAEALTRFGADPRDAEDYFLVGRANLLLAKYPEARKAFLDSKAKIKAGEVDKNNAKTLETDIAIALTVINDSTVQTILKSGLDGTNGNSNAAPAATSKP